MKLAKLLAVCLMLCILFSVFVSCENDPIESESNGKQTSVEEEQTRVEQEQTTAEQGETNAGQEQTTAEQGETNAEQEQTNAEQEQTTAEQEETNAEQEETTAEQEETNAEQGETDISEVESDENSTSTEEVTVTETETEEETKYELSSIGEFHDGLALVSANTGYGYINTKGEIVIEPFFDMAYHFQNGIACVYKSGQYGYINRNGEYIFEPQFTSASTYFDRIARVEKDESVQYINEKGDVIYTETGKEVEIGDISNGYIWVETVEELISGNIHTITYYKHDGSKADISNATHVHYEYNYGNGSRKEGNEITSLNEYGYGIVQIDNYGYVVKVEDEVKIVFGGLWTWKVHTCRDNYFFDNDLKKAYYIDFKTGEITEGQEDFNDLKWRNLGNNFYFVNSKINQYNREYVLLHKDKVVVTFSQINDFSTAKPIGMDRYEFGGKDYFAVVLASQSGVKFTSIIDESGKVIMAPTNKYVFVEERQEYAHGFNYIYTMNPIVDGIIRVRSSESELYGFVDVNGNWVIEPTYTSASDFYGEGDSAIAVVNNNTIIDRNGNVVFSLVSEAE